MTTRSGVLPERPNGATSQGNDPVETPPKLAKPREKKAKPTNLRELIARLVASRRPLVSRADLELLKASPVVPEHGLSEFVAMASADSTLAAVRAVMLTAAATRSMPHLVSQLAGFVQIVCGEAEAARELTSGAILLPQVDQAEISELRTTLKRIRELRDVRIKEIKGSPNGKTTEAKRKVRTLTQAADNLSVTAIAWRFANGALDEAALIELISELFKRPTKATAETRAELLFWILGKGIDRKGVAAVIASYEDKLASVRILMLGAQGRAEQFEGELKKRVDLIEELHRDIEAFEKKVVDGNERISALEALIKELRDAARSKAVLHTDDLAKLRARVVRLLEEERGHLADSLEALRSQPPKTTVAATFIETIHDKIDAELVRLKEAK